ncbi:hypothetical protein Hanom_Chr09g00780531 [Helianthus anomalus]
MHKRVRICVTYPGNLDKLAVFCCSKLNVRILRYELNDSFSTLKNIPSERQAHNSKKNTDNNEKNRITNGCKYKNCRDKSHHKQQNYGPKN